MHAEQIFLTKNGKPASTVFILENDPLENLCGGLPAVNSSVNNAAEELIKHIRRMSGADLPLRSVTAANAENAFQEARESGETPILLGSLAQIENLSDIANSAFESPSGFVIDADAEGIQIAGSTPSAVAIGVYALLEELGVRWFFPGELGTVIPSNPDVSVSIAQRAERPSLEARHFQLSGADEWIRRQKSGGLYFPSAHGIPIGDDASLEATPNLYALVADERTNRQLCLSNPETLQRAISATMQYFHENPGQPWIGMGPNDGRGFCECEECRSWDGDDWDAFSAEHSVTDRYIEFFNRVLMGIEDKWPDKNIAFYIYHSYMRPPVKVTPDSRIVGAIAPIALCRVHGMNNSLCPERSYLKSLIEEWKELLPEIYERGYWFNLADSLMPFMQMHRMSDEIPYYASQGVRGYRTECLGNWALYGPSYYVAGRLMWNADEDVDDVVKDFCDKLFGPSAEAMRGYFTYLDRRLEYADHHAGAAFNVLQFYPEEVRSKAGAFLVEARKLAVESPYAERVEIFAKGFDYFDAFARMQEHQFMHEWEEASECLLELDSLLEELVSMTPPMLQENAARSYLERFYRLPVEQGAARVSDGNRMVAELSSDWQFQIDPQSVGETLGFESPNLKGANWQLISSRAPWSDFGLRYYKGLAWYRQNFLVPEEFAGERLFLWVSSVDETARVWLNGELLGTSPVSAFTPFELDATDAAVPGENTLVVCVANQDVNELGSGGIMGPVFLYSPVGGEMAELENLQPLRDTFP